MKLIQQWLCILLCLVLFPVNAPVAKAAGISGEEDSSSSSTLRSIQFSPMTDLMTARAHEILRRTEQAVSGEKYASGDYEYVLTAQLESVIVAYTGNSTDIVIPLEIDGYDVVALWANAFPAFVSSAEIHGNVGYIHAQAFSGHPSVRSRQGNYAISWALESGLDALSTTQGELMPGVIDLDDVKDHVTRLSSDRLRMGQTEAGRLAKDALVFFTDARGISDIYQVVSKQNAAGAVIVNTVAAEVGDVIRDMTLTGELYLHASDYVCESGVSVEETSTDGVPELTFRSIVFDETVSTDGYKYTESMNFRGNKYEMTFAHSSTDKIQYKIEVVNNQIISADMVRDSRAVDIVLGKFEHPFKEMNPLDALVLLKQKDKDEKQRKELGKFSVPLLGSSTLDGKIEFVFSGALYGQAVFTSHIIERSEYRNGVWVTTESYPGYSNCDGSVGGQCEFALEATATFKLAKTISMLQFKTSAAATVDVQSGNYAANGFPCKTISFDMELAAKVYIGMWVDVGENKIGASTQLLKDAFPPVSLVHSRLHWYDGQFHNDTYCSYIAGLHSIQFITENDRYPLAYPYAEAVRQNGALNDEYLDAVFALPALTYGEVAPKQSYEWVYERENGTEIIWDKNATLRENLEAVTGHVIASSEDLPEYLILYARWENNLLVTFDPAGGTFVDYTGKAAPHAAHQYVPLNGRLIKPIVPSKDYSIFLGWFEDPIVGNKPWDFEKDTVSENMTLYARWDYIGLNNVTYHLAQPTIIGNADAMVSFPSLSSNFSILHSNGSSPAISVIELLAEDGFSQTMMTLYDLHIDPLDYTYLQGIKGYVQYYKDTPICFTITGYSGGLKEMIFPAYINNLPVTVDEDCFSFSSFTAVRFLGNNEILEISPYAFAQCYDLKCVDMSNTNYTGIPEGCFYGCRNLEVVLLPATLNSIGTEAFYDCSAIEDIDFGNFAPGGLGYDCFYGCDKITHVRLSGQEISDVGFDNAGFMNMIDLEIGDNTQVIGKDAFRNCQRIKSLTTSSSLHCIEEYAFYNCTNLKELNLKEGLLEIQRRAFSGCTSLTEVKVPSTVVSIVLEKDSYGTNYSSFENCPNLKKLTIGGALSSIGQLSSIPQLEELVIAEGTLRVSALDLGSTNSMESNLKKVFLPNTLIALERNVFYNCQNLETVVLPRCASIGSSAFEGCLKLNSLTLPQNLEGMGERALYGCSSLAQIKLPYGLISMGKHCLGNTLIDDLIIPSTVTSFNDPMDQKALNSLTICSQDTIHEYSLTNKDTYTTVRKLILEEGVTTVTSYVISKLEGLKEVVLPASLCTIDEYAFANQNGITCIRAWNAESVPGITLPEGLEEIRRCAFQGYTAIEELTLPSTVRSIYPYAFAGCTNLSDLKLNEGLDCLYGAAFDNCPNLQSEIILPSSLTEYANAFTNCPTITKLTIGGALDNVTASYFEGIKSQIKTLVIGEGTAVVSDLGTLTNLEKVVLPSTLNIIGENAFCGLINLSSVQPAHSAGVPGIVLPEGINRLDYNAFKDCAAICSAVLPSSLKVIGPGAFENCTGLEKVSFSEGLESIAQKAFLNCTGIQEIVLPGTLASCSLAFEGCTGIRRAVIGGDAMRSMTGYPLQELAGNLEELAFNEGITTLGHSLMAGNNADPIVYKTLRKLSLPDSLTYIGIGALSECTTLEEIHLSGNVSLIESHAFPRHEGLVLHIREVEGASVVEDYCAANDLTYVSDSNTLSVQVSFNPGTDEAIPSQQVRPGMLVRDPDVVPMRKGWYFTGWYDQSTGLQWNFASCLVGSSDIVLEAGWVRETTTANGLYRIDSNEATLLSYALGPHDSSEVQLPSTWQGRPVTRIAANAFAGEGISKLKLPDFLHTLDEGAFNDMDELNQLTISSSNEYFETSNGILHTKGLKVLLYCPRNIIRNTLQISDSVVEIADYAFAGCTGINRIQFGFSVKRIGAHAFEGCRNIVHPNLGWELEEIGAYAFRNCSNMESLYLNSNLISIGDHAFDGCASLTDLQLPENLLRIGDSAFRDCCKITQVSGGTGLISIGDNAFLGTDEFCVFYGTEGSALIRYAAQNNRCRNPYFASYMLNGTTLFQALITAGEVLEHPVIVEEAANTIVKTWYVDAELNTLADAKLMPCESLTLYGKQQPLYETEQIMDSGTQTVSGVRILAYNGVDARPVLPRAIDGIPVTAIGPSAFDCDRIETLTLHELLSDIAPDAFSDASSVILYAPEGSYAMDYLRSSVFCFDVLLHHLSFRTNGGAGIESISLECGRTTELPVPVRDGCIFAGWYVDELLTIPVQTNAGGLFQMPSGDITLYAAWTIDSDIVYDVLYTEQNGAITITGLNTTSESVVIPGQINGLNVTAIGDGAFMNCSTLTSLTLPEGLESIGSYAFAGTGLESLEIPDSVCVIGEGAMHHCESLSQVTLSAGLESLPLDVLYGCKSLRTLALPEGITTLTAGALRNLPNLTSLSLPDTLHTLEEYALADLTDLRSMTLGPKVSSIASTAFSGCTSLTAIEADDSNAVFESCDGVLYFKDRLGIVRYPQNRLDSVYAIADTAVFMEPFAFEGNRHLKEIIIPEEIIAVPQSAFAGCAVLRSVSLPENLFSIGSGAFSECPALTEIVIPENVGIISENALTAPVILHGMPNSVAQEYALTNGLTFVDLGVSPVFPEVITLPESFSMKPDTIAELVAEMSPENAVSSLKWDSSNPKILRVDDGILRALDVGEAIVTVRTGNDLLAECLVIVSSDPLVYDGGLLEMQIGATQLLPVPDSFDCTNLSCTVSAPDVVEVNSEGHAAALGMGISHAALLNSSGDKVEFKIWVRDENAEWKLPAAIRCIDSEAFAGILTLHALDLRTDDLNAIGERAFSGCEQLRYIIMPSGDIDISESAFSGCPDLHLVCMEGSDAHDFAVEQGIKILLIG